MIGRYSLKGWQAGAWGWHPKGRLEVETGGEEGRGKTDPT